MSLTPQQAGGSAIPGNNMGAMLSSPMGRMLWMAILSQMLGIPMPGQMGGASPGVTGVAGTPPLPPGSGIPSPALGAAGAVPGTATPPAGPPGSVTPPGASPPPPPGLTPAEQQALDSLTPRGETKA